MKSKTTAFATTDKMGKENSSRLFSVYSQLRELAVSKEPGAKLPTTRELMEILDTSWTTLKPALEELEAQNIIYKRQGSGIFVSQSINNKTIAVVIYPHFMVGDSTSPFWGKLLGSLMIRAQERSNSLAESYRFFYLEPELRGEDEPHVPQDFLEALQTGAVDAVISIGGQPRLADLIQEYRPIPHITFAGYGRNMVVIDQLHMLQIAVKALADRGCKRIGFWELYIYTYEEYMVFRQQEWLASYKAVVESVGLEFYPDLSHSFVVETREWFAPQHGSKKLGYDHALKIWSDPDIEKADGIVVLEDTMTVGMLIAFSELGIKVGRDVVVATHSNANTETLYPFDRYLIRMEVDVHGLVDGLFDVYDRVSRGDEQVETVVKREAILRLPDADGS